MNAITNALSKIKYKIFPEVLEIGFVENFSRVNQVVSLDERILSSVIRSRVIVDCNIMGGPTISIPVNGCHWLETFPYEYVITIPKELTGNRSIISVLDMICNIGNLHTTPVVNTSPISSAALNMFNSISTSNVIQTARLELIGDNVVLVQDPSVYVFNTILRCEIENEKDMNNLHPRYFDEFAELCVLAVKSYIYFNCKIKLDKGYIYAGHELGSIGEAVDSYADAEEMYKEKLLLFKKVLYMNNSNSMDKLVVAMVGNTI